MDTLSYKTKSANAATVEKNWVVVDAQAAVLGRFASEVAKIDHLFRCGIRSPNLGFARAERCAFLALVKPTQRPAILKNDTTIHTTKFEERKQRAVGN